MATNKTARTKTSHRSAVRKTAAAKRSVRSESWKKVLERNLILEPVAGRGEGTCQDLGGVAGVMSAGNPFTCAPNRLVCVKLETMTQ
jgi:hypothetical protein